MADKPKIPTYLQNLFRSVKYAATDTLVEQMPVLKEYVDNNKEFVENAVKGATNLNSVIKGFSKKFNQLEPVKDFKTAMANAKKDFASGNYYNKRRMDARENAAFGMDMDFGNFDFKDMEEELGGIDDTSVRDLGKAISTTFRAHASTTNRTIAKSSLEQIKATNSVANKIVAGNSKIAELGFKQAEQHFQLNYALGRRMHQESIDVMRGIASDISLIRQFHETKSSISIDNANKYIEIATASNKAIVESLSLHTELLKKLVGDDKKDTNKGYGLTQKDEVFSGGVMNMQNYMSAISKNFTGKALENVIPGFGLIKDMLFTKDGMFDMMNPLKAMAASPLSFGMKVGMAAAMPKLLKEAMTGFSKSLEGLGKGMLMRLNTMAAKESRTDKLPIWGFLKDVFGLEGKTPERKFRSDYEKGRVPFDGITRKAIIEVIPGFLSKILQKISEKGATETLYDYEAGSFTSKAEIDKKRELLGKNALGNMWEFNDMILGNVKGKHSEETKKKLVESLQKMFLTSIQKGILPEIEKLRAGDEESASLFGIDDKKIAQILGRSMHRSGKGNMNRMVEQLEYARDSHIDDLTEDYRLQDLSRTYDLGSLSEYKLSRLKGKIPDKVFKELTKIVQNTGGTKGFITENEETLKKAIDGSYVALSQDKRKGITKEDYMKSEFSKLLSMEDEDNYTTDVDKIGKSTKPPTVKKGIGSMLSAPFNYMSGLIYKLLYGDPKDLKKGGLFGHLSNLFTGLKEFFNEKLFDPVKKWAKAKFASAKTFLKDKVSNSPMFQGLKDEFMTGKEQISSMLFGNKDETSGKRNFSQGFFGELFSDVKVGVSNFLNSVLADGKNALATGKGALVDKGGNLIAETKEKITSGFDTFISKIFGRQEDKTISEQFAPYKGTLTKGAGAGLLASIFLPGGPLLGMTIGALTNMGLKTESLQSYLFGGTNKFGKTFEGVFSKEMSDKIKKNFDVDPKSVLKGTTLGFLGSLFLPGGPLLGMAIGSFIAFAKNSENLKNILFGEKDENTGERLGGYISKEFQDSFKTNLPGIKLATMGLLPFMLFGAGPLSIAGGLTALAVHASRSNTRLHELLFGGLDEEGKETNGLLSKEFQKNFKEKLPSGLLGAGMGVIPWMLLGGGPVGGAFLALAGGIAGMSDKFHDMVFGEGGIVDKVKTTFAFAAEKIRHNVVEHILLPFRRFGGLLFEEMKLGIQKVWDGFSNVFNKAVGIPLQKILETSIFKPLREIGQTLSNSFKKLFSFLFGGIFKLVSSPLNLVSGMMASHLKSKGGKFAENAMGIEDKYTKDIETERVKHKKKLDNLDPNLNLFAIRKKSEMAFDQDKERNSILSKICDFMTGTKEKIEKKAEDISSKISETGKKAKTGLMGFWDRIMSPLALSDASSASKSTGFMDSMKGFWEKLTGKTSLQDFQNIAGSNKGAAPRYDLLDSIKSFVDSKGGSLPLASTSNIAGSSKDAAPRYDLLDSIKSFVDSKGGSLPLASTNTTNITSVPTLGSSVEKEEGFKRTKKFKNPLQYLADIAKDIHRMERYTAGTEDNTADIANYTSYIPGDEATDGSKKIIGRKRGMLGRLLFSITEPFKSILGFVKKPFDLISKGYNKVKESFVNVAVGIKIGFVKVKDFIVNTVIGTLKFAGNLIKDVVVGTLTGIVEVGTKLFTIALKTFGQLAAAGGAIATGLGKLIEGLEKLTGSLFKALGYAIGGLVSGIAKFTATIAVATKDIFNALLSMGASIIRGIGTVASTALGLTFDVIGGTLGLLPKAAKLGASAITHTKSAYHTLKNAIIGGENKGMDVYITGAAVPLATYNVPAPSIIPKGIANAVGASTPEAIEKKSAIIKANSGFFNKRSEFGIERKDGTSAEELAEIKKQNEAHDATLSMARSLKEIEGNTSTGKDKEEKKGIFGSIISGIGSLFSGLVGGLARGLGSIGGALGIGALGASIGGLFSSVITPFVGKIFGGLIGGLGKIGTLLGAGLGKIGALGIAGIPIIIKVGLAALALYGVKKVADYFFGDKEWWQNLKTWTSEKFQVMKEALSKLWDYIGEPVKKVLTFAKDVVLAPFNFLIFMAKGWFKYFTEGGWEKDWEYIKSGFSFLWEGLKSIAEIAGKVYDESKKFVVGMVNGIFNIGSKITSFIGEKISSMYKWVDEEIIQPFKNTVLYKAMKPVFDAVAFIFSPIIDGVSFVIDKTKEEWERLKTWWNSEGSFLDTIMKPFVFIKDQFVALTDFISKNGFINTIKEGFKKIDGIVTSVSDFFSDVWAAIKKWLGWLVEDPEVKAANENAMEIAFSPEALTGKAIEPTTPSKSTTPTVTPTPTITTKKPQYTPVLNHATGRPNTMKENGIRMYQVSDENGKLTYISEEEFKSITMGEGDNSVVSTAASPSRNNYYSQKDPRWKNIPYGKSGTIGTSACGPTSMAMAVNMLAGKVGIKDTILDPVSAARLAVKGGHRIPDNGTSHAYFGWLANQLGLTSKVMEHGGRKDGTNPEASSASETAKQVLGGGLPVISVGNALKRNETQSPYTPGGHFVVMTGYKDGKYSILDPNNPNKNGLYDEKEINRRTRKFFSFSPTGNTAEQMIDFKSKIGDIHSGSSSDASTDYSSGSSSGGFLNSLKSTGNKILDFFLKIFGFNTGSTEASEIKTGSGLNPVGSSLGSNVAPSKPVPSTKFHELTKKMIKDHEGLRLQKYLCSAGKPTIGYGHQIMPGDDVGNTITQAKADELFEQDYAKHLSMAEKITGPSGNPLFNTIDINRKAALTDMTFNLGPAGINKFVKMRAALERKDYADAEHSVRNSKYFGQVGRRGPRIAKLMGEGIFPTGETLTEADAGEVGEVSVSTPRYNITEEIKKITNANHAATIQNNIPATSQIDFTAILAVLERIANSNEKIAVNSDKPLELDLTSSSKAVIMKSNTNTDNNSNLFTGIDSSYNKMRSLAKGR